MENVNPNTNVDGANPTTVTADPNALVVIPDGGQPQQPTANPNALVSIPDGGAPPGFGPMHAGYGSAGQHMAFGQFNVPLGQNMGYGPAFIQGQIPMVQPTVPNHVMHTAPVRLCLMCLLHTLRGQRSSMDRTSSFGSRRCCSI